MVRRFRVGQRPNAHPFVNPTVGPSFGDAVSGDPIAKAPHAVGTFAGTIAPGNIRFVSCAGSALCRLFQLDTLLPPLRKAIRLDFVALCGRHDLRGRVEPLPLPVQAASHEPTQDGGQLGSQLMEQLLVLLGLGNRDRKWDQPQPSPDAMVGPADDRLAVGDHHGQVGRLELPKVLAHARWFVRQVVPSTQPEHWLRKQLLIRDERPSVAGALLFSDMPQAAIPKHCGIKIYRYKTKESQGFRESLAFDPITIEGCLYEQIRSAVRETADIVEKIPKMGDESLVSVIYPPETLHEIITNAVLHRDYSIGDDVHIRIFDNRLEIESPGKLPAHITERNILDERFARNGSVVRILNKFPDPPNKDVGEGLNTAFDAMHKLGLKEPVIREKENSVLVSIRHEPLASPEEAIMDFLESNETVNNAQAREVTHIRADYQVKNIFGRMVKAGMIEQVPGTRTASTKYRKPQVHPPATQP